MKAFVTMVLLCTLIIVGCLPTRPQRAQKHLAKAISLDPSIVISTQKDSIVYVDSTRIKDSVVLHTKDSVIIIPKTVIKGTLGNPCDSVNGLGVFDYFLGAGANKLHVWSDGSQIFYESTVDSLVSTIQSKDSYISHLESQLKDKSELRSDVKIVEVVRNVGHKILDIAIGIALGIGIAFLGAGMYKLGKFIKTKFKTKASA